MIAADDPLLSVRNLTVHFKRRRSSPFAKPALVHAVDGVSFEVRRGSTLAVRRPGAIRSRCPRPGASHAHF